MRKVKFETIDVDGNGYKTISGKLVIDISVGQNGHNTIQNIDVDKIAAIGVGVLKSFLLGDNTVLQWGMDISVFMDDNNAICNDLCED